MAPPRYNANRGTTRIPLRKSRQNPMAAFDRLPPELRAWLRQAKLPWSPKSCLQIWKSQRAEGATVADILTHLDRIETAMLRRANADAA